jgi:L-alanine-DL-glutamate epimerase-like enolase superfamily enzyme
MEGVFAVGVSGALAADVVTDPLVPVSGEIRVPTGPGLGLELDPEKIARYRLDR